MAKFIADVITPLTGTQHEVNVEAVDELAARAQIEAAGMTIRQLRAVEEEPMNADTLGRLREDVRVLRHRVEELEKRNIGYLGAAIAGIIGVIIVNLVLGALR